ncbi:MAG: phosphate ABC transporter ATP-binding protein [Verrucomicrobiales bacterium]|nr:phosphate ABC transporter ATP-binding protein [Verrucomicrobiales bacterium]
MNAILDHSPKQLLKPGDDPVSIRVKDFSLWYGTFQALIDVSLEIKTGIITSLIGPSGCGKTTLLRSFNRINERYGNVTTKGEITIHKKNILDPDVSLTTLRKSVGMVFQRPNPIPISIYENILFGLRSHVPRGYHSKAELDGLVEAALKEVSLWNETKDNLRRKATELPLEQQQKLCIARLLPLKPDIILMDEPCSALDAAGIERIETLIGELKARFTIVMVTHNMAQARRASDECIFMLMGEIIEHSPTMNLFMSPENEKTAMYIEGRYG